jgi:hypothetical protein
MFAASKSGQAAGAAPTPTDPSFAYVPLLLNTTSTNGQQNNTFLDSSTNNFTITRNGTPTQGSITPYWPNGQWSNNFNGSSNLSVASNAALAMGTGSFTIEFWVFLRSTTNNRTLSWPVVGNMAINCANSGYWNYASYGVGDILTSSIITPLNTWTHVAISRTGTTTRIFINGVQGASTASDSNNWGQSVLNIVSDIAANFLNGYLSNLRIVKGVGVYTGAFTPPTSPLQKTQAGNGGTIQAITGTQTSLLTCQSNRFVNNSDISLTLTVANGTPTVQAFQPFSPTASYTTALYGGSGYFNGSTDYLTAGTSAALNPGAGNFTFECWVYATSAPTSSAIFSANLNGLGVGFNSSQLGVSQTGIAVIITDPATFALNQWVHVAAVRSGTTLSLYKNGSRVATTASSTTAFVASTQTFIASNGTTQFPGYIANLRLINGGATVYDPTQTTITIPTSPVGNTANTSLLLNFTNAGIYDAAVQSNVITFGNAQTSIAVTPKWPPTSMAFDGNGDYLNIPSSQGLNLGTGSLTVEAWVYLSAMSGDYFIVSSTGAGGGFFGFRSGTDIGYGRTGIAWDYQAASGMVINNWYHVAWSRNGTSMRIFVNGSQVGATQTTSQAYDLSTTSTAVGSAGATLYLNGYIQDLRITRGIGRYTANFSVPTAAFPTR